MKNKRNKSQIDDVLLQSQNVTFNDWSNKITPESKTKLNEFQMESLLFIIVIDLLYFFYTTEKLTKREEFQ